MISYAICEINGKQYKVIPNKPFEVDLLSDNQKEVNVKVLLKSEGDKVEIGNPYLKEELKLNNLESLKKPKIRVAKFHAKANYRRVKGFRRQVSKMVYTVKN